MDDREWRQGFKRRLRAEVVRVWGSTAEAVREGAATKSLYRWLKPDDKTVPGADDLWALCERGGISAAKVLRGREEKALAKGAPVPIRGLWRSLAPGYIPEAHRERFGALLSAIATDSPGRPKTQAQATRAALRLVTVMVAELRRQRGERPVTPDVLLARVRRRHGESGLEDYLWLTLKAVQLVVS